MADSLLWSCETCIWKRFEPVRSVLAYGVTAQLTSHLTSSPISSDIVAMEGTEPCLHF